MQTAGRSSTDSRAWSVWFSSGPHGKCGGRGGCVGWVGVTRGKWVLFRGFGSDRDELKRAGWVGRAGFLGVVGWIWCVSFVGEMTMLLMIGNNPHWRLAGGLSVNQSVVGVRKRRGRADRTHSRREKVVLFDRSCVLSSDHVGRWCVSRLKLPTFWKREREREIRDDVRPAY
jgi:hypothetical protein